MEQISILYVDDEQDFLNICRFYLGRSGKIRFRSANSAERALAMLQEEPCDAVVSDYQMPGMDGLELLRRVRQLHPDMPFIFFTGRGREELVIEALESGVDFYVQKSVDPQSLYVELEHKICRAVELRRSVAALRSSEERLRMLVEGVGDPIFSIDPWGTYLYVNPRFAAPFEKKAEEIIGKTLWDVFPKEQADIRFRTVQKVVETGEAERIEVKVVTAAGEETWYETLVNPMRDGEGRIAGVLCASKDITERRRLEDETARQAKQLKEMAEALAQARSRLAGAGSEAPAGGSRKSRKKERA